MYSPITDPQFQEPYIDVDEWREDNVRYRYIHGGFKGTEARFSFFYPDKSDYKGRFFQFMAPVQGSEDAAIGRKGLEDKITFAITHGAYYVETNMGVAIPFAPIADPQIIYKASAACAEYSRCVAVKLYGDHRPYGYVYGGSGGGFKSTSCLENTDTWDGAVPYVIGTPMAIPNMFTVRGHAMRILRDKLPQIADAVDVGGGDIFAGLNIEEHAVLTEVTAMGFPPRSWYIHDTMGDGALPVLVPGITAIDPTYYKDFWEQPGYLGTDANSSAIRDRIQFSAKVVSVNVPQANSGDTGKSGVDEAWKRTQLHFNEKPWIQLESIPNGKHYLNGVTITVSTGDATGFSSPLEAIEDDKIIIGAGFGIANLPEMLSKIRPGDIVQLDNSNYVALQTFHRHQVPDATYSAWDQYRDKDGNPMFPQRPNLVGPMMAHGGAGSIQSGKFNGKMIVVEALMDEGAYPWSADWYRDRVREHLKDAEDEQFRLWYVDRSLHGDDYTTWDDKNTVGYMGVLYQALLDVSNWVESGIAPPLSTRYTINNGQVVLPRNPTEVMGIQPVIKFTANGGDKAEISPGEQVNFSADVIVPEGAGSLTSAKWCFDDKSDNWTDADVSGSKATLTADHVFTASGTYFAVLLVTSERNGDADDLFTQVKNLARVRVIVN